MIDSYFHCLMISSFCYLIYLLYSGWLLLADGWDRQTELSVNVFATNKHDMTSSRTPWAGTAVPVLPVWTTSTSRQSPWWGGRRTSSTTLGPTLRYILVQISGITCSHSHQDCFQFGPPPPHYLPPLEVDTSDCSHHHLQHLQQAPPSPPLHNLHHSQLLSGSLGGPTFHVI